MTQTETARGAGAGGRDMKAGQNRVRPALWWAVVAEDGTILRVIRSEVGAYAAMAANDLKSARVVRVTVQREGDDHG